MLLLLLQALFLNSNEVSALLGSLVPITARPFHVSIYPKDQIKPLCGGCIISKRSALTAAHCFQNKTVDGLKLRAGYDNLEDPAKYVDWYDILKYVRHNEFDADPKLKWENDIAIVISVEDFVFGAFVEPIPMSKVLPEAGRVAFVSSYTIPEPRLTENATALTVKDLQTWNHDRCQEILSNITIAFPILTDFQILNFLKVSTTQFCAIDPRGDDGRIIDGGAPITTTITGGKLLGIASWEPGCKYKGAITFYTTVAPYAAWIEAETKRYI